MGKGVPSNSTVVLEPNASTPAPKIRPAPWMRIYDLALEVDEDISRVLQDPLAEKLYEYDGQFFTPRSTNGLHTAFDGWHA